TVLITPHTQLEPGDFEMHLGQQVTKAEAMDLPQVGSMTLDEIERSMIVKAMKYHQNNVAKVANALGLNRNALYRRLEKYKIPF
ncbi:MAG: helix-turn-helix domain-containing protein, partial [Bacteroidota bacterium]